MNTIPIGTVRPSPTFDALQRQQNRDGRKTQTRRIIKGLGVFVETQMDMAPPILDGDKWIWPDGTTAKPPHGQPGDIWYMREPLERLAARTFLLVTDVRVERVQDISEADALAEGMDANACERIFHRASGKIECQDACWVSSDDEGEVEGTFCPACVKKRAAKIKHPYIQGDGCSESDGPASCDDCYAPLLMSLTKYGIERELLLEDDPDGRLPKLFPVEGNNAAIMQMIAYGIGDLRDEHLGRLAQIGFATSWNLTNGKKPGCSWADNSWVFTYTYRLATPEEQLYGRQIAELS